MLEVPFTSGSIDLGWGWYVLLFFVLVGVVLLVAVVWNQRERLLGRPIGAEIDGAAYQALFLTGGQVYFGKASAVGDHYLLSDVFYLATSDGTQTGQSAAGQLIKRGNELLERFEKANKP